MGSKWSYLNISPYPPCTSGPKEMSTIVDCLFVALVFFSLITLEVFIVNGVLEKTLESLLNCKEIKPVNPKGNQT